MRTPKAPRIKLEVTPEIIADSCRRDSGHCMIAESVKAAVPDARFVAVDLATIRFTDPKKGLRFTYLTPRTGQLALVDFDQGRAPEPFSLTLRGGMVTASGGRTPRATTSTAQREAARKNIKLTKTHLVNRHTTTSSPVPDRVGGATPPRGAVRSGLGNVRAFGIRGLDR